VEEIDFSDDLVDLRSSLLPAERHLVSRLVAFSPRATPSSPTTSCSNLYQHINAPRGADVPVPAAVREAVHVQFYPDLLDTYLPDHDERVAAFAAVENIPSIRAKAEFCFTWMERIGKLDHLETAADRREFLLNLICFRRCIEGLFFFGAFAYVYFLRSKGLLNGLAAGTNWVFRDESGHMDFAFSVIDTVRQRGAGAVRRTSSPRRVEQMMVRGRRHREGEVHVPALVANTQLVPAASPFEQTLRAQEVHVGEGPKRTGPRCRRRSRSG